MKFLVLPDLPALPAPAARLVPAAARTVAHASGRPWIVGSWRDGEVLTASCGDRRIALLGAFRATRAGLERALARTTDLAGLDSTLRRVPGSYHAVASFGGHIRAQGALAATREVFHARVDGITFAADRPDALAALTGAGVDATTLVCHLLAQSPWPLSDRTAWQGVESLGPGRYLHIRPDGSHHRVPWWTPPAPDQPLDRAAEGLRTALADAVAARTRGAATLGCDLSGGMDSTSLAFLAARDAGCRRLVTVRREAEDAANDDATWAGIAARALPGAEPLVLPRSAVPFAFAEQLGRDDDLEAPYAWNRARGVTTHVARELAARGVAHHISGHGGDQLFYPAPSFFHVLGRARPLSSLPDLRVARSMYRWPLRAMVRNLLSNPSYAQWLRRSADVVATPIAGPTEPLTGWGHHPRLPHWVTPDALHTCRALLRDAAEQGVAPHSPRPAQHEVLQAARGCGSRIRITDRLTARHEVAYHAPYLDDQVVQAALAVRIADRSHPHRTKHLLAAAVRGTVPDPVLDRTTRTEFSAEVYAGVRRHLGELVELTDDMRLARLGLVDGEAVRAVLLAPHPTSRSFIPMVATLSCESWLRSVEAAGDREQHGAGADAEGAARARTPGLEGTR